MKLAAGVEWAIHCCVVLSRADGPVSAQRLAEYHGVSRTYLAKSLQALSRAGLVASTEGRVGGYVLNRPAAEITVLDVVLAADGREPAFRCTEIRRNGPFGATPEQCTELCSIAALMARAERAWRATLAEVSIADLADYVAGITPEEQAAAVRAWLAG
ncbi:MAG TPA: Rrf2 family transcriptional regulator [Sporichthyaceae bacterium]